MAKATKAAKREYANATDIDFGDSTLYPFRIVLHGKATNENHKSYGQVIRRVRCTWAPDEGSAMALKTQWCDETEKFDPVSGGPLQNVKFKCYPIEGIRCDGTLCKGFELDSQGYPVKTAKLAAQAAAKASQSAPKKAVAAPKAPTPTRAPKPGEKAAVKPAKPVAKGTRKAKAIAQVETGTAPVDTAQVDTAQVDTAQVDTAQVDTAQVETVATE